MHRWLLPEYIEDVLPDDAWEVEATRTRLLSLFRRYGYELVIPPHIEYIESLTGVAGEDIDLKTFKLVDQLSGRQLGLRADMTPQVARIDAHLLNRQDVARLCYAGHVVHTRPGGHFSTREPLQVGAELFGCADLAGDLEIVELMVEALRLVGLERLHLDLGHVGIFRALCQAADANREDVAALFDALQTKDAPTVSELTASWLEPLRDGMRALPSLFGGRSVLDEAARILPSLPEVQAALETLRNACDHLTGIGIDVAVELGELRSGQYHNGLVFTAFADGWPNPVARGGRYNGIGQRFGRARAATGFSIDLRDILRGLPRTSTSAGILAPAGGDKLLREAIARLREAGEIVRVDLTGQRSEELACDRELKLVAGAWQVVPRA